MTIKSIEEIGIMYYDNLKKYALCRKEQII